MKETMKMEEVLVNGREENAVEDPLCEVGAENKVNGDREAIVSAENGPLTVPHMATSHDKITMVKTWTPCLWGMVKTWTACLWGMVKRSIACEEEDDVAAEVCLLEDMKMEKKDVQVNVHDADLKEALCGENEGSVAVEMT
ncbi:hypothetical protein KI387_016698 [Taxus chinensis]|uniref:Uncharacterized protein n=1 Tax=Taxus chinensis TaxID=29808 RepID=A0AA38GF35_TAXCH|nr:hypothetical protein KI387_016698 [Taxus chinensis]